MKKLKNLLKEVNGDSLVNEKLVKFLLENPNPVDKKVHDWAEKNGFKVEEIEADAYKMATAFAVFWAGGRANKKGLKEKDANKKELAMGVKVEAEHVIDSQIDWATVIARRISLDHLAEMPDDYYTKLKKMEAQG